MDYAPFKKRIKFREVNNEEANEEEVNEVVNAQVNEEANDEEVHAEVNAEALQPPQAPLPCRYGSLWDFLVTCGLLGCKLPVSVDSNYCCTQHQEKAGEFSSQAVPFKCVDGFTDLRATCCFSLLNKLRHIDIGVPTLENEDIFTTLPWDLFITEEDDASGWLFFQTPPLVYHAMTEDRNPTIRWKANPREILYVEDLNHPDLFFTTFKMTGKHPLAEAWKLFLFQCNNISLFCLKRGGDGPAKEPMIGKERRNKKPPQHKPPPRNPPKPEPKLSSLPQSPTHKPKHQRITRSQSSGRVALASDMCGSTLGSHHGFVAEYGPAGAVQAAIPTSRSGCHKGYTKDTSGCMVNKSENMASTYKLGAIDV